jgi:hypothetical protein
MRSNTILTLAAFTVAAILPASAQSPGLPNTPSLPTTGASSAGAASFIEAPAPPPMSADVAAKLLERVTKIQKEYDTQKSEVITSAIARLSSAASSDAAAQALYFDCQSIIFQRRAASEDAIKVKQVVPVNAKDKDKQRQQQATRIIDAADDPGHASVLRLQAEYLMLTLEAPQSKDRKVLVARVRDFVNKAMSLVRLAITAPVTTNERKIVATTGSKARDRESEKARELEQSMRARRKVPQQLQSSVMSTVYAQAFNLATYHKKVEGWVDSPLTLSEIYGSVIMPHYRATNRAELVGVWDEYLSHSLSMQRALLDDAPFARWAMREYKDLQWQKWTDLLLNGPNPQIASEELATLFHDNPTHPSLATWLEGLKAVAEANNKPVEPAPSTGTTPEPNAVPAGEAPFKF